MLKVSQKFLPIYLTITVHIDVFDQFGRVKINKYILVDIAIERLERVRHMFCGQRCL